MKNTYTFLLIIFCLGTEIIGQSVSMTPSKGRRTERLYVKLTGTNFNFSQATNTLTFFGSGTATASKDVITNYTASFSPDEIGGVIFISASATGNYNYGVSNSFGSASSTSPFRIDFGQDPARLVNFTPKVIHKSIQYIPIAIEGYNTWFTQGSGTQTIKFFHGGSQTNVISLVSQAPVADNVMRANLRAMPNAPIGMYEVQISNNNQPVYLKDAFEITWPVAIEEVLKASDDIVIYPVPAKERMTISSTTTPIEEIVIVDLNGKVLFEQEQEGTPEKEITIELGDMLQPKQLYLVKIRTANGTRFVKIAGQ